MSYYKIKNYKIVKTNEGKFNVAGEIADSSIRDDRGRFIFHKSERIYKNDYDTKESMEYALFKDFLDGELHGATGKFKILDWDNQEYLKLSEKENRVLTKLDNRRFNKNRTNEEYLRLTERYNKVRYSLFYRAWKKYLNDKKSVKYVLMYNNKYVQRLNTKTVCIIDDINKAKVFTGNPTENILNVVKNNSMIEIKYL